MRLAALSIGGIIEIIPLVNDIPAWAFVLGIMLITVILEDKAQNVLSPSKLLRRNTGNNGKLNRGGKRGLVRASARIARKAILKV